MCDVCGEFLELLQAYEERATRDGGERPTLTKQEVEVVSSYVLAWPQRQCMCGFQNHKNFERFNLVIQSIICLAVYQLKEIKQEGKLKYEEEKKAAAAAAATSTTAATASETASEAESTTMKATEPTESKDKANISEKKSAKDEAWTTEERSNLLNLLSKLFVMNFPMYVAYKHSGQPKLEEMSQQELGTLSTFCELHDTETPVFLLRYVCFFCKSGGSFAMTDCFEEHTVLPVLLAQSIIAVVCNLKLWLNYRAVVQLFVPLRSRVLRYLCNLSDKDLRLPGVKTIADFMWGCVKDPLDAPLTFDRDGLDLAFKYFSSSTLTMRLAGIAHINAHINMFNELCNSDSVAEVESVGQSLANWLVDNNIIAHIFGPNLHVEVIKQSHILLSFLAMEGKISNEHIDIMWSAAQLKHCSRQVHDLLPPLIKHLEARPVLHLYSLLCKLEPKDHTEQSLFLASSLIKFIWNSSGVGMYGVLDPSMSRGLGKVGTLPSMAPRRHAGANSSSENSVSMDGSNSDDEQVGSETDSSQHSEDVRKTPSTCSEGPTPCKQPRKAIGPVNRPRAPCLPNEDSSDVEDPLAKGTVRVREVRETREEARPVSRRGLHPAGRGIDPVQNEPEIKTISEENPVKQQKKKSNKKKLLGKSGTGSVKSKEAGVKIQECGEDVSDSEEETTLQRVTSPDKRSKMKKKSGLVLRQGNTEFIQMMEEEDDDDDDEEDDDDDDDRSQSSRDSPHGNAVLSELANLVQGPEHAHECRTFPVPTFDAQRARHARELMEDMSGEEEGSYSSRMSNKSEKNMADFDGEESGCEDELVQLAAQAQYGNMAAAFHSRFHPARPGLLLEASRVFSQYSVDAVCRPGNTLLWDLLQDDKICQLGEGLALDAEKALSNLLCYNTERIIRMKFIEGCLENLANHRSVVISLRLLPKLFGSFQQFRGMDTHQVTMWAEHEHNMMAHFFSNLVTYVANGPRNPTLHHHQVEVQVRLQFLTSIYSSAGTPDSFRLSLEQVDTLWACLASDGQCSDELASWLLAQARSTGGQGAPELHALSFEALRHLYLHKLPSLRPESISTVALSLFQHLCNLARVAAAHPLSPLRGVDTVGVDHLWKIALRANNTDVSMTAIQYLNGFYVGRQLEQESEFVSQCMAHLEAATADLATTEESSLLCIQRALLLLRTHLDTFRRRYAYHLRRWALEGRGVGSHVALIAERSPMRVIVQPAGSNEKVTLELQASDLVAELRAEVAAWWEGMQAPLPPSPASPQPNNTPVLGSLLAEGPIRMITQGQELTTDFDEKTLHEMGFKDQQLVFISMGASRPPKKRDMLDMPSVLPPPPRESLPTLLLLQSKYFEQLFSLMHTLSAMKGSDRNGHQIVHTKAQVLSRRVWEILTMLPTSPTLLEGFQALGSGPVENSTLQTLLDPASPQKLMYSLYIVESLSRTMPPRRLMRKMELEESGKSNEHPPTWSQQFTRHGGLRHIFDIFMSGVLQRSGGDGSEWQQDCLATLLKLLCQLGVSIAPMPEEVESATETDGTTGPDVARRKKRVSSRPAHFSDRLIILRLNEAMLQMMDVEVAMPRLTSILYEASLPRDPNHYKTGFWGRAQVVHYAMALLVSWVHSSEVAREALFTAPNFSTWLQRLVLEDPEPSVRREVCSALYRLCLCSPRPGPSHSSSQIAAPMLAKLLEFLPIAEGMRPQRQELHHAAEEGKEPYGPACRDYFWLLCQLVESLSEDLIKESIEDPQGCVLDVEGLAKRLSSAVVAREYLEARHNLVEDEGLVGLLNLTCTVMKHNPPFKTRQEGQDFMLQVFEFLFALPSPRQRLLPKCKSQTARSSAYDMLVELSKCAPDNYRVLHERLLAQHTPNQESPYPWDYWPHEDGRSDCGYVGLTNLGATCYMASCMQHLYMMPQARAAILQARCDASSKHEQTLRELQRMFAYLLESERKAYNPRSFCKVYQMDHQPLNTGEQKDMAEFFIDLVSKLEEMTPELKQLVKKLFCGTLSNNFVSLDCPHVSRNLEEFYTVRCQVADMRNLYESLDEVTVKDTLEGDNMYTCSQCGKKVRAEKRACFKKLPRILCFNTMRYTFNMVTMLKEKVNTHFSFPLRLDMSGYVEKHLMPQHYQEEKLKSQQQQQRKTEQGEASGGINPAETTDTTEVVKASTPTQDSVDNESATTSSSEHSTAQNSGGNSEASDIECYEYDLIGVTVHTGTADGGHYYSFIRDRTATNRDKWFLFNDAEVKPFDPSQIAAECFGGEMTSKTYDSVTDKFMDFSFEKTNSAYMLFYEWSGPKDKNEDQEQVELQGEQGQSQATPHTISTSSGRAPSPPFQFELSKELEDWIWCDNRTFLRDKNIFEHTYFSFMWQMCGYIPQTLLSQQPEVTEMAAQLSASFFLETFIHAKEKPTMVQWVELLTKQFNSSVAAGEWFLSHMASNEWWPMQILIKCPNQMVRQMFHRLCIHVIQRLRTTHTPLYNKPDDTEITGPADGRNIGNHSCVTRFIRMLLTLMEHGAKAYLKHLTEYFTFLYDFCKLGEEEARFLISVQAISMMVNFYMGQKAQEYGDVMSDEEEEEEVISLPTDKYKPTSLEKMIALIASLVEKSRGEDQHLRLSVPDSTAVAGGKGFPFLYQQTKDAINLQYTRNLIFALCRWNERLAVHIVSMIFSAINKHVELCQPFFKLLTLLTEVGGGPSGLPCFTQLVLQHIWEVAEHCPQNALEWLAVQVPRNKLAASWVLNSLDTWVEHYLIAHSNQRVRSAAASLLVALVPSPNFRQVYRAPRGIGISHPNRDLLLGAEAALVQHQIYALLLGLLKQAKHYTDLATHGTAKLAAYFALLTYFAHTRTEKLMFAQYFIDLWQLFHPKLSEPAISVHHNKQALLIFWNHVTQDCPENVALILQNAHVTKNIAFNYILADHEDQDVVMFNRHMLPAYYGLLRACCQQSRTFTRQLASHQNIQWAFKNITPYPIQYADAVEELFKLMHLFVLKYPDSSEQELHEIGLFRRQTLQLYLTSLDGRTSWSTLISAFRTLIDSEDDRLHVIYNGGLQLMFDALCTLHVMYHEATACHVGGDLQELLSLLLECVKSVRVLRGTPAEPKDAHALLLSCKDWPEALRRIATLLNTYNPPDLRTLCIDLLKEILLLAPSETLQVLVPLLSHCHTAYQDSHNACPMGPYFPRRGHKMPPSFKVNARPQRPMVQMIVPHSQIDFSKGGDDEYEQALSDFYTPYHSFIDVMCRLAINVDCMTEALVNLSAVVGFEAVPLHLTLFPKLWLDIHQTQHIDRKYAGLLVKSSYLVDYVEAVLLDERSSLNIQIIYNFLCVYFPKVAAQVLNEQTCALIENLVTSLANVAAAINIRHIAPKLNGDMRALILAYSSDVPLTPPPSLFPTLQQLLLRLRHLNQEQTPSSSTSEPESSASSSASSSKPETSCSSTEGDTYKASKFETTEKRTEEQSTDPQKQPNGEKEEEAPSKKRKMSSEEQKQQPPITPVETVATAEVTKPKQTKKVEVEKESESKSVAKPEVQKPEAAETPRPYTHTVNWLLILEKTVFELHEIVKRKLGAMGEKAAALAAAASSASGTNATTAAATPSSSTST